MAEFTQIDNSRGVGSRRPRHRSWRRGALGALRLRVTTEQDHLNTVMVKRAAHVPGSGLWFGGARLRVTIRGATWHVRRIAMFLRVSI